MKWNKDFQNFLEELKDDEYVGLGNPNAKILFVGKEAANDIGSKLSYGIKKEYTRGIDYSESFIPNPNDPDQASLRDGKRTWQKYQKLYEEIYERVFQEKVHKKDEKYEITFVNNVFTTELSSLSAPNTRDAVKHPEFASKLVLRKESFWSKDFISKRFPITLIFGGGNKYITYDKEIFDIFQVPYTKSTEGGGHKIDLHYLYGNQPRLLIRTRQLVGRINTKGLPELIIKLAEIVSEFIKENNIEIRVK